MTDLLVDCDTILCDLWEGDLVSLAGKANICAGDLGQPETVVRLLALVSDRKVRSFVHAAGISPTMASASEIVRINLVATLALCDAAGHGRRRGGSVLFIDRRPCASGSDHPRKD